VHICPDALLKVLTGLSGEDLDKLIKLEMRIAFPKNTI